MKFHFSIEYRTQWGEELRVRIGSKEYPMSTSDGCEWDAEVELGVKDLDSTLNYQYALYRENQLVWTEWEVAPHTLKFNGKMANRTVGEDEQTFGLWI